MRTPFKRLFSLCLCLALALALFPGSRVEAAYEPLTGLYYSVKNGVVTIEDCDASITGALVIPDTIEGFPVTVIGALAFSNCKGLTKITLGNHVTTIDSYAFEQCSLSEITFPASVIRLDANSLNGILTLKSVVFLGDPPQLHKFTFGNITKDPNFDNPLWDLEEYSTFRGTVYYPTHNPNWTPDVMQRYGALKIAWEAIHSRDAGTVITAATCTAEGTTSYVCSVCSEIEIVTTPPLGHSWDKGTVTSQPTCTENGVRRYTCTTCSGTYEEAITATGHSWDKGTVTSQPTCTENGVRCYTCTTCSDIREETIAPTGHTWGDNVVVGTPNCLEPVTVDHICTICGTVGNRQTLPAPGHSYESILKPATCTDPGQIVYTCKTCGDTRSTETSPATGHQYETGTCIHCGITLIGDLTGDNTVDIADVARLYAHIRNTTPLEEPHLQNADTTGDGTVDIADVAKLYAHTKGTASLP